MLQVGAKVVYPTHGVGMIEAVEEREILGRKQTFYILRILGNGGTIMVPTRNAKKVGLREVIHPSEVSKVMEILKRNDVEICPNWNRRFKDNLERIRTGSLYEEALVLRRLLILQKERSLSFGEKRMLETVRNLIVGEIAHAMGIDEEEARAMIERIIATA